MNELQTSTDSAFAGGSTVSIDPRRTHAHASHARRTGGSFRAWAILLITAALGLAADLVSKTLAFRFIGPAPVTVRRDDVLLQMQQDPASLMLLIPPEAQRPVTVIPHVLDLQLVLNAGAVFGAGQGKRWVFIGFTVVILIFAVAAIFPRWTSRRDHISHVAIGLIVSGGLGNLYDRLRFACVRDFLHPLPTAQLPFGLKWPNGSTALWPYVSNVADALLLIGIGILMLRLWRTDPPLPAHGS